MNDWKDSGSMNLPGDVCVTDLDKPSKEKSMTIRKSQAESSEAISDYVIVSVKTDNTPKIVLTIKKRTTLYDPNVVIWDTAATVHIFRNLDLFSGTPVPVNDDDISFVGFDTSSGNAFVVSKGILKHPFQGINFLCILSCSKHTYKT